MFFAFDVDGTLTPSRQQISPRFGDWLLNWISVSQTRGDSIMLVTGSDRAKTVEQLGEEIVSAVRYCCNCMGNVVYYNNKLIHNYKFQYPNSLSEFLNKELESSVYSERCGNHIEDRGAMLNFSTVGRLADSEQRKRYNEWDKISGERLEIARKINELFNEYNIIAQVAGEIGIDITAKGKDKSQCIKYIENQTAMFFGDRMDENGNDKPLADAINASQNGSKCFEVDDWEETWEILKGLSKTS